MITISTVLILGAGASEHCGYPLGASLISRLCSLKGASELNNLPEIWTRSDAESFLTQLSRSGYNSIDAFLEKNSDQAPLGKFLIAREMKKHEDLNFLFPPHNSGWYQYLFNKLIIDEKPQFSENKLGIVTFNYDRSLEAYLHTALQNRFKIDATKADSILKELPIIHVHGILGEYPSIPYQTGCDVPDLLKISRNIQIIHEIKEQDDGFCNPMFEEANKMLKSASRVFFLGFGFHPDNVRRFRFFTPENIKEKILRATSHGVGPLEREQLVSGLANYGLNEKLFPASYQLDCNHFFKHTVDLE